MAVSITRESSPPRPRTSGNETISTISDKSLRDENRASLSTNSHTTHSTAPSNPNSVTGSKSTSRADLHPPDLLNDPGNRCEEGEGEQEEEEEVEEEENQREIFSSVDRGAPGDGALIAMVKRGPEDVRTQKRKSQFYSEVFAYREPLASPRERVVKDSIVSAHVRTNVIISDEYTFLTSLSSFLSTRYCRPASSILITLDHSACLLFGGSFDPAYQLTISALPAQVQATMNKRNAALLATFFEDELHVAPNRGVIRFEAIPEECLATSGKTCLGEIESLSGGMMAGRRSAHGRGPSREEKTERKTSPTEERINPVKLDTSLEKQLPREKVHEEKKRAKIGRRKSFLNLFGI